MNLNNYVVYRRLRLGPLHQLHPGGSRSLIRYHNRLHRSPSCFVIGHAARSTRITQLSRSLALITGLGTTGILTPKALNATRLSAVWIASITAIAAFLFIMY